MKIIERVKRHALGVSPKEDNAARTHVAVVAIEVFVSIRGKNAPRTSHFRQASHRVVSPRARGYTRRTDLFPPTKPDLARRLEEFDRVRLGSGCCLLLFLFELLAFASSQCDVVEAGLQDAEPIVSSTPAKYRKQLLTASPWQEISSLTATETHHPDLLGTPGCRI